MRKTTGLGMVCLALISLTACSKSTANNEKIAADSLIVPADPAVAGTIGFFMNRWGTKRFTVPAFTAKVPPVTASLTVNVDASAIVQGNLIGTDRSGLSAISNEHHGIFANMGGLLRRPLPFPKVEIRGADAMRPFP